METEEPRGPTADRVVAGGHLPRHHGDGVVVPSRESVLTALSEPRTEVPARDPQPLTAAAAEAYLGGICFKIGPPRLLGVELEWLTYDQYDFRAPVTRSDIESAVAAMSPLPAGSSLTWEPGGQLEISSQPADDLDTCVTAVSRDLTILRRTLAARGLRPAGYGVDCFRPPRRVLEQPRYAAMEAFFDRQGPWGRTMMCRTASVQVCVDGGLDGPGPMGLRRRWDLVHLLGPVLVAAFANSPLLDGRPTGWRSTRQAVWDRLEPCRTALPPTGDPRVVWPAYVLDASVMCVRRPDGLPWLAPAGLTFRRWINGGGERPPTWDDLDYHVSTLFPPVRPRGHLELRMVDAQPDDGWLVPLALVTALTQDPVAADVAYAATQHLLEQAPSRRALWLRAARAGLSDPALAETARACFGAGDAALGRLGAGATIRSAVAEFADRYVERGRCPADDLLEALRGGRTRLEESLRC